MQCMSVAHPHQQQLDPLIKSPANEHLANEVCRCFMPDADQQPGSQSSSSRPEHAAPLISPARAQLPRGPRLRTGEAREQERGPERASRRCTPTARVNRKKGLRLVASCGKSRPIGPNRKRSAGFCSANLHASQNEEISPEAAVLILSNLVELCRCFDSGPVCSRAIGSLGFSPILL